MKTELLRAIERLVGEGVPDDGAPSEALELPPEAEETWPRIGKLSARWCQVNDAWLLTWTHEKGARAYEVQTNPDPTQVHRWSSVWCGLDEGTYIVPYSVRTCCWTRVRALYEGGHGPWSDPLLLRPGEGVQERAA